VAFGGSGEITIESLGTGLGDSDTISSGPGIDILIGGGAVDQFPGGLKEDWVVQYDAFIITNSDLRVLELISDSANRSVIFPAIIESAADASAYLQRDYAAPDVVFDYQEPASDRSEARRTDRALSLTPLLNGEYFARLSDAELREFLGNLPLQALGGGSSGEEQVPFEQAIDVPAAAEDKENANTEAEVIPSVSAIESRLPGSGQTQADNHGSALAAALAGNSMSPASETAGESSALPLGASLLMATRASGRKGWTIGGLDSPKVSIQGDFAQLRKTQADRVFKHWQRDQ